MIKRRERWMILASLLCACAPSASTRVSVGGTPATVIPTAKPAVPVAPPAPPPMPQNANFLLVVSEAVDSAADDLGSYTRVYVDGKPAGETPVAPKSQEKEWGALLPAGNHLFRFEKWNLPSTGDWAMLDPQWQPVERFIRVEPGQKTIVSLKFYDGGTKNDLRVVRQPLAD